jgi:single-stranded-DNA-specific exonuclease
MNLNNFDFPDFFKHILLSRQLDDNQKLKKFLFPEYKDLYNPFLMKNMLNSVEIIFEHIYSQKKILIFGDKDVDGITSIIILYNTIKGLGGIV